MTSHTAPARPKRTLIFHIGDHKTGSTSIQTAFAKRHVQLERASVFYPATMNLNVLGGHCEAYAAAATPEAKQAAGKPFRRLAARIQAANEDFALVSAEAFEVVPVPLSHEIIQTFFADCAEEIRVVAYVRPHPARIVSSYAERLKIGGRHVISKSIDDFALKMAGTGRFLYYPRFQMWREYFGDAFLLRPMIRERLMGGSVVEDFIHHAFGGIGHSLSGDGVANESLCLEDLMRLKVLYGQLPPSSGLRHAVGWEIQRIAGLLPPPELRTKLRLHRSLAEEICATYLDDARAMDRGFFGAEPVLEAELERAANEAAETPQSVEPGDYFTESELRSLQMLSRMIAGLLEEASVDWPSFLRSKRVRDVEAVRRRMKKKKAAE